MRKAVFILLITVFALSLAYSIWQFCGILSWHRHETVLDFPAFYLAADMARKGENPYDLDNLNAACRRNGLDYHAVRATVYPPSAHVLLIPLSCVPLQAAQISWLWLKLLLLGVSMVLTVRNESRWESADREQKFRALAVVTIVTAAFHPLWMELLEGQMNVLILCVLTVAAYGADRSPWLSGAACGMGASIKVLPGLLLPWFIIRRRWQAAIGGLGFISLSLLAGMILMGHGIFILYLKRVFVPIFSGGNIPVVGLPQTSEFNRSLWASVLRMGELLPFVKPYVILLYAVLGLVLITLFVSNSFKHKPGIPYEVASMLPLMALLSPIAWHNFLVILLLPLWILALRIAREPKKNIPLILMLALLFPFLSPVENLPEYYLSPILPALLAFMAMLRIIARAGDEQNKIMDHMGQ